MMTCRGTTDLAGNLHQDLPRGIRVMLAELEIVASRPEGSHTNSAGGALPMFNLPGGKT